MRMDPMFDAIFTENLELLKVLLNSGRSLEVRTDLGWTLLHAAVSVNRIDIVQYLVNQHTFPVNAQCFEGKTSLLLACETEDINPSIIKCILNSGADVNIANNDGITPLHAACRIGNSQITELLLKKNADTNSQEFNGYTPLHYTSLSNCVDILHLLLRPEGTVDINATDFDGCTALMLAVDVANREVALELIKYGADANVIGRETTALHLSVVTQQPELFKPLWEKTDFAVVETLAETNNLVKLMVKYGWFFPDRVEVLFDVLDHPDVGLIFTENVKILRTFFYRIRFVKNVKDINVCDVLRKFLRIGVDVNENDLKAFIQNFYKYESRYELLDILIQDGLANFDNVALITFSANLFPNLVPTLLSFCIHVQPLDIFNYFSDIMRMNKHTFKLLILVMYLCTPNAFLRKKCRIHLMTFSFADNILGGEADNEIIEIYKYTIGLLKSNRLPSLKELARDEYRKYLSQFCTNSYEYLDLMRNMSLPRDIIDLIQCKMAVNLL